MEPIVYHPEGDPFPHHIVAEVVEAEGSGLVCSINSDGEEIGQVDVELLDEQHGFISGIGPGKKINNGFLQPASLAIAACLGERDPRFKVLYDINDDPIGPST